MRLWRDGLWTDEWLRWLLQCLLLGVLVVASSAALRAEEWSPCHWNQETCWCSISGSWEAIVSSDRARLVYFGTGDGRHNLLYPPGAVDLATAPDWGGHRFWLGPQWKWDPIWPAPPDWERSPADLIEVDGATLTMRSAHRATGLPQLSRAYTWLNGDLCVKATWVGDSYQGIHIFQVPILAQIGAEGERSPTLPRGFGLLRAGSNQPPMTRFAELPAVLKTSRDGQFMIRYRAVETKLGFNPRTLTVYEGKYGFQLKRGQVTGRDCGKPDDGLLTQVYTGNSTNAYMEVEQLSAVLATGEEPNGFEVLLKPFVRSNP